MGDIDGERAAIAFSRALVEGPDGPELRSTKTHRTCRVELDAETLDVLVAHRATAEDRAEDVGAVPSANAFVFSSRPDGAKPWLPNWLTKRFIAARRDAGLPHFRLHDLRHFMATEMLAAGVPIATVSQRLVVGQEDPDDPVPSRGSRARTRKPPSARGPASS